MVFGAAVLTVAAGILWVSVSGGTTRGEAAKADPTHIYIDQTSGTNSTSTTGAEGDPFKSISYAINVMEQVYAAAHPWHLHIKAGTYDADSSKPFNEQENFPIELAEGMTIEGDDGAEACIISGAFSSGSEASMIEGDHVRDALVKNLTFADMAASEQEAVLLTASDVEIEGCVFSGNYWGIRITDGDGHTIDLDSNTFTGNYTGTYVQSGSPSGSITGNTFSDHSSTAIAFSSSFTGDVTDNTFTSNTGTGITLATLTGDVSGNVFSECARGFSASSLVGDVTHNTFLNNAGAYDLGFSVATMMTGNVTDNTFVGNSTTASWGGAAGFGMSTLNGNVLRNVFTDNSGDAYGGVFSVYYLTGNVQDNVFNGNTAGTDGGAMSCAWISGTVSRNLFNMNAAAAQGGVIYLSGSGGAADDLVIANNLFLNNHITGSDPLKGSAIATNWNATIVNNTFLCNDASSCINLYNSAAGSVILNNIFDGAETVIWEEGLLDPRIEHNDFYDAVDILYRDDQRWGNNLDDLVLFLDNCINNYDWAPGLEGTLTAVSQWTEDAIFDPVTNRTELTDADASWDTGEWDGKILNIGAGSGKKYVILTNTNRRLYVQGDVTRQDEVQRNMAYYIEDYRLHEDEVPEQQSQNIDAGTPEPLVTEDMAGEERPQGNEYDVGAYESTGVVVLQPEVEILPVPGPVQGLVGIDYLVTYTLRTPVSLSVWYSTDGGSTFSPATMGVGGDGDSSLPTSSTGLLHTYMWNSLADVSGTADVIIKMTATDGTYTSDEAESDSFSVQNTSTTPKVTGAVKDARTDQPLSGVSVTLYNAATAEAVATASTDSGGSYSVTATESGMSLRIAFAKSGYEAVEIAGFTAPILLNVVMTPDTPNTPTGLTVVSGANEILLRWNANTESDLAGYRVYRDAGDGSGFVSLEETLIQGREYADRDIELETAYQYKLSAVDADGNESSPAGPVSVQSGVIVVWVPDVSEQQDAEVRIPINVTNAAGIDPAGIDIDLYYPADMVASTTGIRVERTAVTAQVAPLISTEEAGRIRLTSVGTADTLRGKGHLFDVYLTFGSSVELETCGLLEFNEVKFYDETPTLLPTDYTDTGVLCVRPQCMLGDMNDDGTVDSADVIITLKVAVDLLELTDCRRQAGDVNGDGDIDSADALMIQRLAVGLPINPPQAAEKVYAAPWELPLSDVLKEDETVTVELESATAEPGETVSLSVKVSDASGLAGLDATVGYSSERSSLILESVEVGHLTSEFEKAVLYGTGYVDAALSASDALDSGTGEILILNFQVADTASPGTVLPITLNAVSLQGQYGDNFDWYTVIEKTDGEIRIGSVTVSPSEASVYEDRTYQLSATSDDPLDTSFSWTSDNESVATVDGATGLVTGVSIGTATITATGSYSGLEGTATVEVEERPTVTVSPTEAAVVVDSTYQFSATSTESSDTSFSWASDNESVATVDADTGEVTGVSEGSATITATGSYSGEAGSATVNVTVGHAVTVSPAEASVFVDGTYQLSATSTDTLDTSFAWASDNELVATVDASTGLVTGVSVGSATITATGSNSGASDTATVEVEEQVLVTVSPSEASVLVDNTYQFSATSTDTLDTSFAWTSDNELVATVNASTGLVTGVSEGTATITATGSNSGETGSATVNVSDEDEVTVSPSEVSVVVDGTYQLSATSTDSQDTSFAWASDNELVATVNASTGLVTGVSVGSATITATGSNSGLSDDATVQVTEPVTHVLTLQVSPSNGGTAGANPNQTTYDNGATVQLTATANNGWEFDRWEGDVQDSTSASTSIVMNDDETVTAVFVESEYVLTLNVSPSGAGSATPSPNTATYVAGTQVSLAAVADSGWAFDYWDGNVTSATAATTWITMNSDETVTAVFAEKYQLTVSTSGTGTVTVNPDEDYYESGTAVSLVAVPGDGWEFVEWEGGGVANATAASTSITMNADQAVTAVFGKRSTPVCNGTALTQSVSWKGPKGPGADTLVLAAVGGILALAGRRAKRREDVI